MYAAHRPRGRSTTRGCVHLSRLVILFLLAANGSNAYLSRVQTKFGQIQGLLSRSVRGRLVAHYLGVPYAQPPVGDLRFRSPQPWNHTWNDIYEALQDGPMCLQLDSRGKSVGREDCLYLNIFVPMLSEKCSGDSKLPVMVFIHGGKYMIGSSDSRLYSPEYLMDQNIILVTINYRLNVMGFFSTANGVTPGNYGVKDALMALRWIHENIGAFQGDPNSVTLWGHSAGTGITHILALSNKTEGLFGRYILQSGSALAPWVIKSKRGIRDTSLDLATLVGCHPGRTEENTESATDNLSIGNSTTEYPREMIKRESFDAIDRNEYDEEEDEKMMRCMRTVGGSVIVKAMKHLEVWRGNPWCIFAPTIEDESDDAVLTMHPIVIMKHRLFRDIPFMIGVVKDEGLEKSIDYLTNKVVRQEFLHNFEDLLPYVMEFDQIVANTSALASTVEDFYFQGDVAENFLENITELFGDNLMIWPAYETLKWQADNMNSSTYFYIFEYEGTFSSTFRSGSSKHYGVSHVDDLNYLIPVLNKWFKDHMLHNTETDVTMINIMTEMWASFATKGVPEAWEVTAWPDYKHAHQYLQFGINRDPEIIVGCRYPTEKIAFWENLVTNTTLGAIELHLAIEPPSMEEQKLNSSISTKSDISLVWLVTSAFTLYLSYVYLLPE
ncbi:esterase FE4-like [Andrena cerasifolii]|uniref:esterase FE4-like n=1 Tax=Andrena cerasifolii TaxID=2819439 RepID=UPI00403828BA